MALTLNLKLGTIKVTKLLFSCLLILGSNSIFSQNSSNHWVYLKDKKGSSNIALSAEAKALRIKNGIALDQRDLSISSAYLKEIQSKGYKVKAYSRWLNAVVLELNDSEVNQIMQLDCIVDIQATRTYKSVYPKVEQSHNRSVNDFIEFDSSYYGATWRQNEIMNIQLLHERGYYGQGIKIAVMDNGYFRMDSIPELRHLLDSNRIVDQYDFVDNDSAVYDEGFHGIMVLSTMAGDSIGHYVGTAPMAEYMLYVTEDNDGESIMEEYNWVMAAERADSMGAQILNTSLGYTEMEDSTTSHTYDDMDGNTTVITKASDIAASKGMLVINSAGNSGNNSWFYIGAPADGDSVLTVGAVGYDREIAGFSSRGPTADGRLKPNVSAPGVLTAAIKYNGDIGYANGTSFSCPILSGSVACLWQAYPDLTNMELFRLIEISSDRYLNPDNEYGHGIPDMNKAFELMSDSTFYKDSLVTGLNNVADIWVESPYGGAINIFVESEILEQANISVYNIQGRLLYQETRDLYKGFNHFQLDQNQFDVTQIFILKIDSSKGNYIFKMIKK